MALGLLLSSDLHLGMKFAGYPAGAQETLVEARFQCLQRIVAAANAAGSGLLVIAGDLFQSVAVSRRDVERAAATLGHFSGRLAAVMPGNHDFVAPGDTLWQRFRDAAGDRVLVLDEPRPYPLGAFDLDACLYPAPCTAKHSDTNALGWVARAARDRGLRHHVGIAHGSLEGFSPDMDGRYFPMRRAELRDAGVDLWLLGHTHVPFSSPPGSRERFYCAGTPEPDGWDCAHQGAALSLSVADDGAVSAAPVATGALRFIDLRREIRSAADVASVEAAVSGPAAGSTLLRLRLHGRADESALAVVPALRERLSASLRYLDLRTDELTEEITAAAIDRAYPAGSFPHALLSQLSAAGDGDALALAHELLQELRA
jgi:DNA repair protein SbcD/Mre11